MFNSIQLRELIIRPVLHDLIAYSEDAVELLIFTCAVESDGGTYIKQIKGPALGIYQMEPDTYNDLWMNYIKNKPDLIMKLFSNFGINLIPPEDRMIYDLRFATAMARIFYMRTAEEIPRSKNREAVWDYYKKYWNTKDGNSKKDASIRKYLSFMTN